MASHDRPTGEVAFLFTDIEGSTRLVERLGTAAWTPLLARHRAIVRDALGRHGGYEAGTEGDSFFVTFAEPASAVLAAGDIQRALHAEPWPDEAAIRVRMGIHVGAGELDADGSYVGHDVHRAARIAGAAHGGQVLLSEAAVERTAGRLGPGLALRPLGEHRLKDLRPERITQLLIDGTPAEFPAIRSLDARPNNLPTQLTSFIGRERELAEASALLERTRLLTLTGPGGTGKSRLALQLAADVADRFPDGVWFVPLAALRDPQLLLPSIARAIEAAERVDRSPQEIVVDALAGKRALLVLDNLEQLLPAATQVVALLRELPQLRIVVTSRAPLRVSGEQEYPVPGLPVPVALERLGPLERERLPEALRRRDPEGLMAFEGTRLFVARGAAVRPGFALTDENAGDVAAIVAHLGGVPLALELAAARVRFLTPAAIHERLEGRLDLPGPGGQDVPERQRTLRGAIQWSYELLEPGWRRLFERLGVFVGGFDLQCVDTVSRVGDVSDGTDVLDGLATLVDHSLVRSDDTLGEPRFSMLEPIREFAIERLEAAGDAERVREAHARAYLELVARAEPKLSGADQRRWLDRLELEHGNVRAALDWAEANARADLALPLAARVWRFWQKRGHLREARRRLERLLAQPWAQEATPTRGDAAEAAGGVAYWQGDFRGALPFYQEALAIRRATGSRTDVAHALYNLSFCYTIGEASAGDPDEGRVVLKEALDLFREEGDDLGTANALWGIGVHHYFRNENAEAVAPFEEALLLYRRVGERTQEAWSLHQLGSSLLKLGEVDRAGDLLRDALRIFDATGDLSGTSMILDGLSAVAVTAGDLPRAARLQGLGRRLQQTSGTDLARFVQETFEAATRATAGTRMDPADLARHAAEGAAMSLEEGVRYALEPPQGGHHVLSDDAPPAPEAPA